MNTRRPRTAPEFFAMSERVQDRWTRMTQAISKMRTDRLSLAEASRQFGLDARMVARLGKSALRRLANGHYTAKPTDTLLRVLVMPTHDGLTEIAIRDSREASLVGAYWAAVQKYLQTGDTSVLQKIRRKTIIDAGGKRVRLIKDAAELDRIGSAGVLSFESLYAKVG